MSNSVFFLALGWFTVLLDGWVLHTHILAIIGFISLIGGFYLLELESKDE